MAYRDNWLAHLLAPFTGNGFSDALAADFWTSREDLWNADVDVKKRWLKLVWVYVMSAITQITFPAVVALGLVSVFKEVPLVWWVISIGGGTAFGIVLAVLIATGTYVGVRRRERSGEP